MSYNVKLFVDDTSNDYTEDIVGTPGPYIIFAPHVDMVGKDPVGGMLMDKDGFFNILTGRCKSKLKEFEEKGILTVVRDDNTPPPPPRCCTHEEYMSDIKTALNILY